MVDGCWSLVYGLWLLVFGLWLFVYGLSTFDYGPLTIDYLHICFTKARERTEGRKVPRKTFVQSLFKAKENVQKVKDEFGDHIKLHVLVKNFDRKTHREFHDVKIIDRYVKISYTQNELIKKLL